MATNLFLIATFFRMPRVSNNPDENITPKPKLISKAELEDMNKRFQSVLAKRKIPGLMSPMRESPPLSPRQARGAAMKTYGLPISSIGEHPSPNRASPNILIPSNSSSNFAPTGRIKGVQHQAVGAGAG